jgi:hypothetical protein
MFLMSIAQAEAAEQKIMPGTIVGLPSQTRQNT